MAREMSTTASAGASGQPPANSAKANVPKHDWADPAIPAGNSPPLPRWPLIVSAVVFTLWVGFLVAMAIIRIRTTSV